MKKLTASLFILFAATSVFAKPVSVDAFNQIELTYMPINEGVAVLRSHPFLQPTFIFYVSPYIASKHLRSDVVSITCNGNEVLVAPGSSYACVMRHDLSWRIDNDYQHNGADIGIMVIPDHLIINSDPIPSIPSDGTTIPKN